MFFFLYEKCHHIIFFNNYTYILTLFMTKFGGHAFSCIFKFHLTKRISDVWLLHKGCYCSFTYQSNSSNKQGTLTIIHRTMKQKETWLCMTFEHFIYNSLNSSKNTHFFPSRCHFRWPLSILPFWWTTL